MNGSMINDLSERSRPLVRINLYPAFDSENFLQGHTQDEVVKRIPERIKRSADFYPMASRESFVALHSTDIPLNFGSSEYEMFYLSDGMFCILSRSTVNLNDLSFGALREAADSERSAISDWLQTGEAIAIANSLQKCRGSRPSENPLRLGYAHSQNILHAHNATQLKNKLYSSAWISSSNEDFISADVEPAVSLFEVADDKVDLLVRSLVSCTLLMASLYEIQEQSMKLARYLAELRRTQRGLRGLLRDSDRKSGLFLQHAVELSLLDFLSDPFGEMIGRTTIKAWEWSKLTDSTIKAVKHLSEQVVKLNMEMGRQSDSRVTKLLVAFTLLTVVDVCGNMIMLYDISNAIIPYVRITSVFLALILSVIITWIYVRRV
jgi:hypothetical protein